MSHARPDGRALRALASVLLALAVLVSGGPAPTVAPSVAVAVAAPVTASLGFSEDDVVYMILTDRYPDGDPSNNDQGAPGGEYVPGNNKYYQGGDWQGIINKLPYIKNLGVTAIWISPVSDNELLSRDASEAGYHGYFTRDFYSANPHFGTKAKLQELVNAAHANGIRVILDVVPNHTADYLKPFATSYESTSYQPALPFNNPDWYHKNGDVTDWNNQWLVENGDIGGLDDLAQENTAVATELKKVYQQWFAETGADAARVDAARSLPKSFLQEFETAVGVPTFGEVFHGDVAYVADYQNYQWGELDFPFFFNAREVFAYDNSFQQIKNVLDQDWRYKNTLRLLPFLDNHDRDRFLALADDNYRRLRLALTFLFTARGIPVVYYGTEQAYYGGGVPTEWQGIANNYNREPLRDYNENHVVYKHIQRLSQLRKDYPALRRGTQREMWIEPNVYAYSRRVDSTGVEVITAMTNSWDPQTRTIPLRTESTIAVGTVLTNLLNTSDTVTVQSDGTTGKQITVSLGGKEAKLYAPGSAGAYTPPTPTTTKIRVHYNAGYGNTIWIRGDTYPLWWDKGRAARHIGGDVWEWELERIPAGQSFQFKPLINDLTYSVGNNFVGTGGQTIDVYPVFRDPAATITRIRVHRDAGQGNSISLRGSVSPLNWTSGVQATWSKGHAWTWETTAIPVGQPFDFKALINDVTWQLSNNYTAVGGSTVDVYPIFNTGETERTTTTLRVYRDVGTSNDIWIRGSTAPLSWTAGQRAAWSPQNIWVWETTAIGLTTAFEFKPLINDITWSAGGNSWSRGGMTVEIYPSF